MRNPIIYLLLSVFLFSVLLMPSQAIACSCAEPPGIEEELNRSDAVFSGKVIAIDEKAAFFSYPSKSIVFQVGQVWKGVEQSQVKIVTGQGDGDCGFDFAVGQDYLVYTLESNIYGSNALSTGICDRTKSLNEAQGDFAVLGVGREPAEEVDLLNRNRWLYGLAVFIGLGAIAIAGYRKKKKSDERGDEK